MFYLWNLYMKLSSFPKLLVWTCIFAYAIALYVTSQLWKCGVYVFSAKWFFATFRRVGCTFFSNLECTETCSGFRSTYHYRRHLFLARLWPTYNWSFHLLLPGQWDQKLLFLSPNFTPCEFSWLLSVIYALDGVNRLSRLVAPFWNRC